LIVSRVRLDIIKKMVLMDVPNAV